MPTTLRGSDNFDTSTPGLGYGQTWQDVSASRSIGVNLTAGTTYTNSTAKPIQVALSPVLANGSAYVQLTVGGVVVARSNNTNSVANQYAFVSAIVPPGATYSATTNSTSVTTNVWTELR